MSSKDQLGTSNTDAGTGQVVGEGFLVLRTSAGNRLVFRSPAERDAYRINNGAQFTNFGNYSDKDQQPT